MQEPFYRAIGYCPWTIGRTLQTLVERGISEESAFWRQQQLLPWSCPSSFRQSHMGMLTEWVYLPTETVYHEGSGFDISSYSGP